MFDPYYKWLGIPPKDQPPNHYRLLGIEIFEADSDVIDTAANKQMAYIQGCANGPHLPLSQKLLNEIAAARLCLLDPKKKAAYDAALKANSPKITLATPVSASPSVSSPRTEQTEARSDLAFQEVGPALENPRPRRKKRPKYVLLGLALIPVVIVGLVLVFTFGRSLFTADATKGKSVGQVQQKSENPGSEGKKKTSSQAKADGSSTDGAKKKPEVPLKEQFTFLADMQESEVKVAHPGWFSKEGLVTILDARDRPMLIKGTRCPHSIYMHPPRDSFATAAFRLDKSYQRLKTEAAIPSLEDYSRQGNPVTPLTFEVLGDGKSLWKSGELQTKEATESCDVSIKGVESLELRVYCPGADNWAIAAWIEPKLFKQQTWKQIGGTYFTDHDFHKTLGELILDFGPGELPVAIRAKGRQTQRCKQVGDTWMFDWGGNDDLFVITPQSDDSVVMRVYWKECTNSFNKAVLPNRPPNVTVVFFRSKKG